MNETDANRALLDAAALRAAPNDPLEITQRMPVADRRGRQHEGRMMHEAARGPGHARAMVNNPFYRNQEIAAGLREPPGRMPDFRDGRCAHGYVDFMCRICAVEQGRIHEYGE